MLLIQVGCFVFDTETGVSSKSVKHMLLGATFTISAHLGKDLPFDCVYEITAVIEHLGESLVAGHYVTYVKGKVRFTSVKSLSTRS